MLWYIAALTNQDSFSGESGKAWKRILDPEPPPGPGPPAVALAPKLSNPAPKPANPAPKAKLARAPAARMLQGVDYDAALRRRNGRAVGRDPGVVLLWPREAASWANPRLVAKHALVLEAVPPTLGFEEMRCHLESFGSLAKLVVDGGSGLRHGVAWYAEREDAWLATRGGCPFVTSKLSESDG
jgi:hypothetical protein